MHQAVGATWLSEQRTHLDVVVGIDLATQQGQRDLGSYILDNRPLILLMSPPCTGLKSFEELRRWLGLGAFDRFPRAQAGNLIDARWVFTARNVISNHSTRLRSSQHSRKLGHLCGQIAQEQLRK